MIDAPEIVVAPSPSMRLPSSGLTGRAPTRGEKNGQEITDLSMNNPQDAAVSIATDMLKLSDTSVSRHFVELGLDAPSNFSCSWFLEFFNTLEKLLKARGDHRIVILVLCLDPSKTLTAQTPCIAGIHAFDNATVYLYEGEDFFTAADEEYRKILPLELEPNSPLVLFRSWRDSESARHNWEYNNSIYIWREDQSQRPVVVK